MEAVKKHTRVDNKRLVKAEKREVVIITKQRISTKDSLFPGKLKKANELLKDAVLMKY